MYCNLLGYTAEWKFQ